MVNKLGALILSAAIGLSPLVKKANAQNPLIEGYGGVLYNRIEMGSPETKVISIPLEINSESYIGRDLMLLAKGTFNSTLPLKQIGTTQYLDRLGGGLGLKYIGERGQLIVKADYYQTRFNLTEPRFETQVSAIFKKKKTNQNQFYIRNKPYLSMDLFTNMLNGGFAINLAMNYNTILFNRPLNLIGGLILEEKYAIENPRTTFYADIEKKLDHKFYLKFRMQYSQTQIIGTEEYISDWNSSIGIIFKFSNSKEFDHRIKGQSPCSETAKKGLFKLKKYKNLMQ